MHNVTALPQPDVIADLERLLADFKAGREKGIGAMVIWQDTSTHTICHRALGASRTRVAETVGMIHFIAHELLSANRENPLP